MVVKCPVEKVAGTAAEVDAAKRINVLQRDEMRLSAVFAYAVGGGDEVCTLRASMTCAPK